MSLKWKTKTQKKKKITCRRGGHAKQVFASGVSCEVRSDLDGYLNCCTFSCQYLDFTLPTRKYCNF